MLQWYHCVVQPPTPRIGGNRPDIRGVLQGGRGVGGVGGGGGAYPPWIPPLQTKVTIV